jgi:hypothetical protein
VIAALLLVTTIAFEPPPPDCNRANAGQVVIAEQHQRLTVMYCAPNSTWVEVLSQGTADVRIVKPSPPFLMWFRQYRDRILTILLVAQSIALFALARKLRKYTEIGGHH